MIEPTSPGVREISASLLHLRSDLVFAPSLIGENPFVMVEDPLSSRFYRLGKLEYAFASLLDGKTTLREVYAKFSKNHPEHHLTENDAIALCRWLVEMELASTASKKRYKSTIEVGRVIAAKGSVEESQPLSFRLPIWQPDATMEVLSKRLGWMFSVGVFPLWCLLIAIGTISVASDWDRFSASSQGIFGYENWLWLALSWAGLKVAHELAHGVACKRHGGNVREAGTCLHVFCSTGLCRCYIDMEVSFAMAAYSSGPGRHVLRTSDCGNMRRNLESNWKRLDRAFLLQHNRDGKHRYHRNQCQSIDEV